MEQEWWKWAFDAWESVYSRLIAWWRGCRSLEVARSNAEANATDALCRLLERLRAGQDTYVSAAHFANTWAKAARNRAIDQRRREARYPDLLGDDDDVPDAPVDQLQEAIWEALTHLSHEEQQCVRLKHFDGLTFESVGVMLFAPKADATLSKTERAALMRRARELHQRACCKLAPILRRMGYDPLNIL